MKITATIITYNEERNIARAMESLRCCDEIVVVDSGSSDRTAEIAQKLGARVIESPWGGYARQKNHAADQAGNDWILSIDADEALSEALEGEIWHIKTAIRCRASRSIWGGGFSTRAGIPTGRSGCTTGGRRSGWGSSFTSQWL
jgi:glycosyltransferase involved in cell wall biosynthesis